MRWLLTWGLILLVLAGCNLSPAPLASETVAPSVTAPPAAATQQPTRTPQSTLPPLPATPTQFFPGQAASPQPVTLAAPDANPPAAEPLPQATIDPATANDRYEITARSGQQVGIIYEVAIPAGMSLSMVVQGPDGVVWQRTLTADASTREEFAVEQGGVYELLLFRQGSNISYAFSWD